LGEPAATSLVPWLTTSVGWLLLFFNNCWVGFFFFLKFSLGITHVVNIKKISFLVGYEKKLGNNHALDIKVNYQIIG